MYHVDRMVTKGTINTTLLSANKAVVPIVANHVDDFTPRYLYHYTSSVSAENILKNGFDVNYTADGFLYFTDSGNLKGLQAQIELALPVNQFFPEKIIKIDYHALKMNGISPVLGPRRIQGNLPGLGAGGGKEILFNCNISTKYIIE